MGDKYVKDTYAEWGKKLKGQVIEDPAVQSLLDLHRGSKESRLESLRQEKQLVGGEGSSATHENYYKFEDISATDSDATQDFSRLDIDKANNDETDDSDNSDMDLSDDEPKRDDDAAGFGVFMYIKSLEPLKSTYLSPTVTCSYLEYIQSLLNKTPTHELTDLMSNPVYMDAHTTSAVANPEGNPEEMFLDKVAYHISSPPSNTTHTLVTNPQHNSLQAKAKKLMQKAKKNMRKINFKKVAVVQAKVLTKMKKLLPAHVPKALTNYVKPRLNNSVLKV
ncbi:hypothetical protein Tco_1432464, partial [Tanacetum coccineum]